MWLDFVAGNPNRILCWKTGMRLVSYLIWFYLTRNNIFSWGYTCTIYLQKWLIYTYTVQFKISDIYIYTGMYIYQTRDCANNLLLKETLIPNNAINSNYILLSAHIHIATIRHMTSALLEIVVLIHIKVWWYFAEGDTIPNMVF